MTGGTAPEIGALYKVVVTVANCVSATCHVYMGSEFNQRLGTITADGTYTYYTIAVSTDKILFYANGEFEITAVSIKKASLPAIDAGDSPVVIKSQVTDTLPTPFQFDAAVSPSTTNIGTFLWLLSAAGKPQVGIKGDGTIVFMDPVYNNLGYSGPRIVPSYGGAYYNGCALALVSNNDYRMPALWLKGDGTSIFCGGDLSGNYGAHVSVLPNYMFGIDGGPSSGGDSGLKKSAESGGNMDLLYDNSTIIRDDGTNIRILAGRGANLYTAIGDSNPVGAGLTSTGMKLYDGAYALTFTAPTLAASSTLTWPAANASGVLTNNGSGTLSWAAPTVSGAWESTGGNFQAKTADVASGDTFNFQAKETDGATAYAFKFNNANDLTTAGNRHSSWSSDGTEWAYMTGYGELVFPHVSGAAGGYRAKGGITIDGSLTSRRLSIKNTDQNDNAYDYPILHWYGDSGGGYGISSGHDGWMNFSSWGNNNFYPQHRFSYSYPFAYYSPQSSNVGYTGYLGIDGNISSGVYTNPDTGFWKSAKDDGILHMEYDGVDVQSWGDKIITTDNTTTTIWSQTLSDNQVHAIEIFVVARRTDSAGRWSGKRRALVYRAGGGATLEGSVEPIGTDVANGITPTVTIDTNSNDVRVRVTGETAKTINWRVYVSKVHAN